MAQARAKKRIEHYIPELLGQFPNYPSSLFVPQRGLKDVKAAS